MIDLARGKIKPVVSKLFHWTKANEAIKEIQKRTGVGRTVLTFPGSDMNIEIKTWISIFEFR
jgi:D-arabinose 1-dehydrogenase-like Zn-dependent alcohol dehydrogenase